MFELDRYRLLELELDTRNNVDGRCYIGVLLDLFILLESVWLVKCRFLWLLMRMKLLNSINSINSMIGML